MIENYKFKYKTRGKQIYVPNERCVRKGNRIIDHFKGVKFPDYFYHYKPVPAEYYVRQYSWCSPPRIG